MPVFPLNFMTWERLNPCVSHKFRAFKEMMPGGWAGAWGSHDARGARASKCAMQIGDASGGAQRHIEFSAISCIIKKAGRGRFCADCGEACRRGQFCAILRQAMGRGHKEAKAHSMCNANRRCEPRRPGKPRCKPRRYGMRAATRLVGRGRFCNSKGACNAEKQRLREN